MAGGDGKPPGRKRAAKKQPARKTAAKAAPRKRAVPRKVAPTKRDRAKAREQIATVTPIKSGSTTSQRGRHNAGRPGKGKHAPTSPTSLALHERRVAAVNLRRLGLQWSEVAAQVRETYPDLTTDKYDASDAHADMRAIIDSVTIEAVQGVREEDLATLLAMQRKVYPAALDGDLKAVGMMLKVLDQRARYLGLYAPTRHELTGTGGGPLVLGPQATEQEVFAAAWTKLEGVLASGQPVEVYQPPEQP